MECRPVARQDGRLAVSIRASAAVERLELAGAERGRAADGRRPSPRGPRGRGAARRASRAGRRSRPRRRARSGCRHARARAERAPQADQRAVGRRAASASQPRGGPRASGGARPRPSSLEPELVAREHHRHAGRRHLQADPDEVPLPRAADDLEARDVVAVEQDPAVQHRAPRDARPEAAHRRRDGLRRRGAAPRPGGRGSRAGARAAARRREASPRGPREAHVRHRPVPAVALEVAPRVVRVLRDEHGVRPGLERRGADGARELARDVDLAVPRPAMFATSSRQPSRSNGGRSQRWTTPRRPRGAARGARSARWSSFGSVRTPAHAS